MNQSPNADTKSVVKRYCLDARTTTDHFPGIGRYVSNLARAIIPRLEADEQLVLLVKAAVPSRWGLPPPNSQVLLLETDCSPFAFNQQWLVPRLLRRLGVALYHSPYYLMPYLPGVPTLLTVYDLIPQLFPALVSLRARIFFRMGTRLALTAAKKVVAISTATREDFIRHYGIKAEKISAIPLAPDPRFQPQSAAEITRIRQKHRLPSAHFLYLGINKPHKNLLTLARVWQRITAANPDFPPLTIAGAWDPRYPQVKQFVSTHKLENWVRFLGPIPDEDLPALYCSALAFLFPSQYEGFGLPVAEAMACGTAVACANSSSLPEITGDAALLFDPIDEEEMQRQINWLFNNAPARQELALRGWQQSQKFSWSITAAETIHLYRQLVTPE